MRAAARAILDEAELDADKINALEAPADLGPEIIPASWTPDHIGKRIAEAFVTLGRLPPLRGPRVPGNSWPEHIYEWADRLAQEEMSEKEKARRRRSQNVVLVRPTAEDLRRMEIALGWLSDLARADADLCRILQRWARLRSIPGRSIKEECRRAGLSHQAMYRLRDKALVLVAARLTNAPVW